jgi:glycerol-3-phosphate O-acyltransferase
VQVSFAEPIRLEHVLDEVHADWRAERTEDQFRPEWVSVAAETLGLRIITAINEAAVVNAVNLVALVMLCTPKQAIVEVELRAQLEVYRKLVELAPYASRTGRSALSADAMIEHCENMGWLSRRHHALGDILYMDERRAVLLSYYRNNILHLFALPSLIASAFNNHSELTPRRLAELITELYPCLRSELSLRLTGSELEAEIPKVTEAMLELGLLESRPGMLCRPVDAPTRVVQLELCAEIIRPILERYYLSVALLLGQGSGALRKSELIERCRAASEQLAMVYSLSAPDLFQAGLFSTWIACLRDAGVLDDSADGKLEFADRELRELAGALAFVLPPRLRQTLINLAGMAAGPLSGIPGRSIAEREPGVRRSGPESGHSRAE